MFTSPWQMHAGRGPRTRRSNVSQQIALAYAAKYPVAVFNENEIPHHFSAIAKELIKKLLETGIYTQYVPANDLSALNINSLAQKATPYRLKFYSAHPSVNGAENYIYNVIYTNIYYDAVVKYQANSAHGDLYLDVGKIAYPEIQINHQHFVVPLLNAANIDSSEIISVINFRRNKL
jgi:hypothetical protein